MYRSVDETFKALPTMEGAGVHLKRAFGYHDIPKLDPFLMFDFFNSRNPDDYSKGFPWHPHRGIETVTYLIDGEIKHEDSIGNSGIIGPGDCQWMSAGGGILHQEMPIESDHMFGFQLWVNLPRDRKMSQPMYRDITKSMIPVIEEEARTVKIIGGEYQGVSGGASDLVGSPNLFYVSLKPGASFEMKSARADKVALFVISGKGKFEPEGEYMDADESTLIYSQGDEILIEAGDNPLHFIYLSGQPLDEPIAWGGPIVMNTKEELLTAQKELQDGTFIKK